MKYNYDELMANMFNGVYFVDRDRRITYWNKAAERITGFPAPEVLGSRCSDNILTHVDAEGNSLCKTTCPLARIMEKGSYAEVEVYLHHKQGYRIPVRTCVMPLHDENGNVVGGAEFFTDNSAAHSLAQRMEELEKLSLVDPLTGLANRRKIEQEIFSIFQEKQRFGISFGILFMDIDHFKQVNDRYGHDAGDLTLKTIARTIMSVSRPFDLFGRWGGEEFIGIIRSLDRDELAKVGNRYRALIGKTNIHLDGLDLQVTISIGAAIAGPDDTPESIVKRADSLMYASKQNGRNRLTTDGGE
jgi:diguanylate cyclase (GGDEF)-like protein/PAS domain S-box-containing protein